MIVDLYARPYTEAGNYEMARWFEDGGFWEGSASEQGLILRVILATEERILRTRNTIYALVEYISIKVDLLLSVLMLCLD